MTLGITKMLAISLVRVRSYIKMHKPQSYIWKIWIISLVVILLINLLTLNVFPAAWLDEVSIIEFGRIFFDQKTDWSINWNQWQGNPIFLFSYLGPALQELAYRVSNQSLIGPRLASLLGALIAASIFLGYLLSRQTPKKVAYLIALLFLLNPLFTQSYRGVRLECWAIAVCFGACWALRSATLEVIKLKKLERRWLALVALSGGLFSLELFIWPSAVLLLPLILVEFINLIQKTYYCKGKRSFIWIQILVFTIFAAIVSGILTMPIWHNISYFLDGQMYLAKGNETLTSKSDFMTEFIKSLNNVRETYRFDPIIPIIFFIGVIFSRDNKLKFITILVASFIVSTLIYPFRAVYLLPYFLCLMSGVYPKRDKILSQNSRNYLYRFISIFLSATLILYLGSSLFIGPVMALRHSDGRKPNILYDAGATLIGAGSHNVYLNASELYYAGRSLGWKMFDVLQDSGERHGLVPKRVWVSKNVHDSESTAFKQFISKIDFVIYSKSSLDKETITQLEQLGFKHKKTYTSSFMERINKEHGGRFRGSAPPYGPYFLYSR